jgi:hypothetical protein
VTKHCAAHPGVAAGGVLGFYCFQQRKFSSAR